MSATVSDNGIIIGANIDITRIEQALNNMKRMMTDFASNATKSVSETDKALEAARKNAEKWKIEPTTEGIEEAQRALDILNATIVNQQSELANCRAEYERVSSQYGENSSQALKLERRMLSLESSISKNIKKSDAYGAALADADEVMQKTAKSADELGDSAKKAGDGMSQGGRDAKVFDTALGTLIGNGLSKVIGKCGELLEQTKELRRDLSFLEQNANDAGVSMEFLHDKAGDLYAITGDTNEVVEALSNILATGFNDAGKAAEAVDLLAGAVVKFPETMKIESLADSLQETIAAGEATGQFSELLTRLGVDVDKFNERLGKTSANASRQTLVLQTLRNEGLGTLWESYKEGNETMIEAEKANYELQLRYAELAKSIEPIETKIKSTFAQVLLEHEDQILAIVDAAGAILGVGVDIIAFLSQLNPAVVLIGGGLAVVALKAAGTALGMQIMAKGTAAATTTLASAGPAAAAAGSQFLILAADLLIVGAAVFLVTSGIAMLISAIRGIPVINIESNVPSMSELQSQVGRGYALGTRSATPGWRWVGERGPELMRFAGGEAVYTAEQSRALVSASGGAGNVYHDNRQYIFRVDDIETYAAIERKLKNQKMTTRQGFVN